MVLDFAIINISRSLELASNNKTRSISSHSKLKEDNLSCLKELLTQAPLTEYQQLLEKENREIVIGYLLSNLCRLAKDDKSRSIRMRSLNIVSILFDKFRDLHDYLSSICSTSVIRNILPGVCSCLFKIIMGDTKQSKDLLVIALEILTKSIVINFQTCEHSQLKGEIQEEISENLGIRIVYLIDYIIDHNSELGQSVLLSTLELCQVIVEEPKLLKHDLNCMVRFIAFMSSRSDLKNLIKSLRDTIGIHENLDSLISVGLVRLLEDFVKDFSNMLPSEREAQISVFAGYLYLTPAKSLTTLFELEEFRDKLVELFQSLTKFSNQQSFLFLTNTQINEDALETNTDKICRLEKRFEFDLTKEELSQIEQSCSYIGNNLEWNCLNDLLCTTISDFSCPSKLLIVQMILKGLRNRNEKSEIRRYLKQILKQYIEFIDDVNMNTNPQGNYTTDSNILKPVLALETVVTIIDLMRVYSTEAETCRTLHVILSPLLASASSTSRSISEVSLSSLAQVANSYGYRSIKDMIESNTDYVVDGISKMLDNWGINDQISNIIAITFKLSSIETFFYFKDIYERVFKLIGIYHWHSLKTRSIALLFSRTIEILSHWSDSGQQPSDDLKCGFDIKIIAQDIDIDGRIAKLTSLRDQNDLDTSVVDEGEILANMESRKSDDTIVSEDKDQLDSAESEKKVKPIDVEVTEKILIHSLNLVSANDIETKILALKCLSNGFKILSQDENVLLPIVHKAWAPLYNRLTNDYSLVNLEINLSAFECLLSMARYAKDFIKHRTLDSILPRICLFLESQAIHSSYKKEYGPYCTTMNYKCQLLILENLGPLVYNIELGYKHLWRIIDVALKYLNPIQVTALNKAARHSLLYLMTSDCDCVWYFAKKANLLKELPFDSVYELKYDCGNDNDKTNSKNK